MGKVNYSGINAKAAAITGGVVGFLCWLLIMPYSSSGYTYGMMGYVTGYGTGMMNLSHSYSPLSIILDIVLGAIFGAVIALIYNWVLELK